MVLTDCCVQVFLDYIYEKKILNSTINYKKKYILYLIWIYCKCFYLLNKISSVLNFVQKMEILAWLTNEVQPNGVFDAPQGLAVTCFNFFQMQMFYFYTWKTCNGSIPAKINF